MGCVRMMVVIEVLLVMIAELSYNTIMLNTPVDLPRCALLSNSDANLLRPGIGPVHYHDLIAGCHMHCL